MSLAQIGGAAQSTRRRATLQNPCHLACTWGSLTTQASPSAPAGMSRKAAGLPLAKVIETPLGTGFVPRAIDVDSALLAGRLQRMEDTTKVYKALVRQGLGWAKVFQRVRAPGPTPPSWCGASGCPACLRACHTAPPPPPLPCTGAIPHTVRFLGVLPGDS